jgi:hypothetical protein
LSRSISQIFFSRRQALISFSRAIAARMSPNRSKWTKRKILYRAVNAGNGLLAMFDHPAFEIVGYADVEVSRSTGENINAVGVAHS